MIVTCTECGKELDTNGEGMCWFEPDLRRAIISYHCLSHHYGTKEEQDAINESQKIWTWLYKNVSLD